MNLILLQESDFVAPDRVCLRDRRLQHVREVHRAAPGDSLRVGFLGGPLGTGRVVSLDQSRLELQVTLDQQPPTPLDLRLLLALPRPKVLRRVLRSATELGIKRIYLFNSYRVEKSFWGSPLLQPQRLQQTLQLGLEQACDTILPQVYLRPRFKPFVEDELSAIAAGSRALVAHPGAGAADIARDTPLTLAIGPEGGFIPYELDKLRQLGFSLFSCGPRILRVETAVPALVNQLTLPQVLQ